MQNNAFFHIRHKYSLLMHCIKIKSLAIFLWNQQNVLYVDLSMFNQSYSGGITTTKSLPDIGGTTYHSRCPLPIAAMGLARRPHHERWAYTSNYVQYISGF